MAGLLIKPYIIETTNAIWGQFGFEFDPLPIWVIGGTSTMIPRPVVRGTIDEVKGQVREFIVDTFKKRYGSNVPAPEAEIG